MQSNCVKLIAISSRTIDQRDIDQYDARGKFNIRHSYRDDTLSHRYSDHLAREGKAYSSVVYFLIAYDLKCVCSTAFVIFRMES
jgi:hypothetical protein